MRIKSWVICVAASSMVLVSPAAVQARPVSAPSLSGLTGAISDRLALADTVAASKWVSGAPIDDPVREQVVLDSVSQLAVERGLDPMYVRTVFRDQIEASKTVQRGLFFVWSLPGQTPPPGSPDLGPVRTAINELNVEIVDNLAAQRTLLAGPACYAAIFASTAHTIGADHLDPLHVTGLIQAQFSVCGSAQ
jgi:chorismate mutase